EWVEFDVQLTQDGKPIIFHDDKLNRTTNGKGLVSATDFETISLLDAGSWFSDKYQHESIPTWEQYLQTAADLALGINVELKGEKSDAQSLAQHVVDGLAHYWSGNLPRPLISSFSVDHLQAFQQIQKNRYPIGYITYRWNKNWLSTMKSLNAVSLHVFYRYLTPERIQAVKNESYLLLAYTVNEESVAKQLLSQGVDAVFSDDPTLLLRLQK
ncbi:MAG TPA: glycerophosphodiester phosphodiesterase family protein, partial [Gammaproteobacteria bacterium]|nr:glycerophosphodiester phosphodiesterase family protein [Gammaproteobacteria bacterium]